MLAMKSLLIFAICFLVGAAVAVGVRAAVHKPYAEATQVHDMAAPPETSVPTAAASGAGHEGHGAPSGSAPAQPAQPAQPAPAPAPKAGEAKPVTPPAPGDQHQNHGTAPAKAADPRAAIGNTICPGCGMEVDADMAAIPTPHGLVGVACPPCVPKITREPERYGAAARENRKAQ